MNARPTLYLEAADSVRSRTLLVEDRFVSLVDAQRDQSVQVLGESLMALAMGVDLVVPESYALDSYAVQRLVQVLREAEAIAAGHDTGFWNERTRPMRIHLYSGDRFVDIANRIFTETGRSTWTSSLYPDLGGSEQSMELAALIAQDPTENPLRGLPDLRSDLFEATWAYFRSARRGDARRVVPAPGVTNFELNDAVCAFAALVDHPDKSIAKAARAIAVLTSASPESAPFASRSRFHSSHGWADGDGGPSAEALVRGAGESFAAAREVVDTLYNRRVVNSIDAIPALYTTQLGGDEQTLGWDRIQDAVLIGSSYDHAEMSALPFEISIDRDSLASAREVLPSLIAEESFAAILRHRESATWQKSFEALAAARSGTDRDRVQALDRHVALMSTALNGLAEIERDGSGSGFTLAMRGIVNVGFDVGAVVLAFVNPWLSLLGVAPDVARPLWGGLQHHRERQIRIGALGKLVAPRLQT